MNRRTGWKRGHATIVRGGITDAVNDLYSYEDTDLTPAKAAELKERATPKTVLMHGIEAICPSCWTDLFCQIGFVNFCGKCGQALKWSEPPEEKQE